MTIKKALLVIDMQKGSFTEYTPRYNIYGIIQIINSIAAVFRLNSLPVLFIQHDGAAMNEFIPGSTDWELLDGLEIKSEDILISKYANDIFYGSDLKKNPETTYH